MNKTMTFAIVHLTIAFSIAYILTGEFIIASMVAMLEPTINTAAYYFHELVWKKLQALAKFAYSVKIKTSSFAVVHFAVAFSVVYLLTGDPLIGGLIALIEPSITTFAYYLLESHWQQKQYRQVLA